MRKYGESKTTQIMMATVRHVTSRPMNFCWTEFFLCCVPRRWKIVRIRNSSSFERQVSTAKLMRKINWTFRPYSQENPPHISVC